MPKLLFERRIHQYCLCVLLKVPWQIIRVFNNLFKTTIIVTSQLFSKLASDNAEKAVGLKYVKAYLQFYLNFKNSVFVSVGFQKPCEKLVQGVINHKWENLRLRLNWTTRKIIKLLNNKYFTQY